MSIRANVDARRLNERVVWQRNTPVTGSGGDAKDSWGVLGPSRAAVDGAKASGPEPTAQGSQVLSKRDYTVWVRSDIVTRYGLTAGDRALWRGRYLNIKDIPDQQLRGRLMAVICDAGMNAG